MNQNSRVKENINNELNIWHWDQNSFAAVKWPNSTQKTPFSIIKIPATSAHRDLSTVPKRDLKHSGTFPKICMRPWIRSLWNILPKRPLRDDLLAKKLTFVEIQPFGDLKNSKCRASPVGIGSDTPSFWNLQSNFVKHELLQKTETLHATLDSHLVFN